MTSIQAFFDALTPYGQSPGHVESVDLLNHGGIPHFASLVLDSTELDAWMADQHYALRLVWIRYSYFRVFTSVCQVLHASDLYKFLYHPTSYQCIRASVSGHPQLFKVLPTNPICSMHLLSTPSGGGDYETST
jgi:hypothetical protein